MTLTDSLLIDAGFAVGTVGEGTFWSTGVLEPALDAPDAGRGIPAGGGDTPNVCPGCPPICDARRPAMLGFAAAGPIEPGRDGAFERVGCAAEGRVAEVAVEEVGVAVLEGLPEGGWEVDEGVPYVLPFTSQYMCHCNNYTEKGIPPIAPGNHQANSGSCYMYYAQYRIVPWPLKALLDTSPLSVLYS